MAVDLGRIAFQAFYSKMYPNRESEVSELWKNIKQPEQDAWRHAAVAVLQQIDREKEYANLNDGLE